VLFQLGEGSKGHRCSKTDHGNRLCPGERTQGQRRALCALRGGQELYSAEDAPSEQSTTDTEPEVPGTGPFSILNPCPAGIQKTRTFIQHLHARGAPTAQSSEHREHPNTSTSDTQTVPHLCSAPAPRTAHIRA